MVKNITSGKVRVYKNYSYLLLVQIATYFIPLALVPILVKNFGLDIYGVLAFLIATTQFSSIITDYGFSLLATEKLSRISSQDKRVSFWVTNVLYAKLVLAFFVSLIIIITSLNSEFYSNYQESFFLVIIIVFMQAVNLNFFFQAFEKMAIISIANAASKFIYFILVYTLIDLETGINVVLLSLIISNLIFLIITVRLYFKMKYKILSPNKIFIILLLKSGFGFFVSRACLAIYTIGGTLFLGVFGTSKDVAIFSLAEQIYRGIQTLFQPFVQASYPYIIKTKNIKFAIISALSLFIVSLIGLVLFYFIGEFFIVLIFTKEMVDSVSLVSMFLFVLLVSAPSMMIGYPAMSALQKTYIANKSVIYGSILYLTLISIAYALDEVKAKAIILSILISEILVFLYRLYYVIKR